MSRFLPFVTPALFPALFAIFLASCVTTGGTSAQDKAARNSVANIKGGLEAYRTENGRWPSSVSALESYASARGRRIDKSPFSSLTLRRPSSETVLVEFVTRPPASQKGGFALSRIDVH